AAVACFLVFRLRSILGRRTGHQENTQLRDAPPSSASENDNVISLPGRRSGEPTSQQTLEAALSKIRVADPNFTNRDFVNGAKRAFPMIVESFASGDTASLRPLLGDDLYDDFSTAIRDRNAAGETLETEIEDISDAQIVDAELDGRKALITVRFTSKQRNVTRNAEGEPIEGDPDAAETVTDLWTFVRNTRSKDPTWALVRTEVPSDSDDQERGNG
ncbi:MAG: Tim44/TimA family putative adaptor protein, partial [Pseudomonadota bacterium]